MKFTMAKTAEKRLMADDRRGNIRYRLSRRSFPDQVLHRATATSPSSPPTASDLETNPGTADARAVTPAAPTAIFPALTNRPLLDILPSNNLSSSSFFLIIFVYIFTVPCAPLPNTSQAASKHRRGHRAPSAPVGKVFHFQKLQRMHVHVHHELGNAQGVYGKQVCRSLH